jgi:allantoinase
LAAARQTGARVHVLHVSSREVLPLIAAARAEGLRLTAETCPHYLTLAAEDVPDRATAYKCCPPIRSAANQDALWEALVDGVLDIVVSDHSPSTPDLKQLVTGDFAAAWGGIAGLQLGLPVMWTAASERGLRLDVVVRWMAERPAAFVGLTDRGAIVPGRLANLVAFDPDASFTVDPAALQQRNPLTPYAGATLRGVVRATWLRGEPVDPQRPRGTLLTRVEQASMT